MRNSKIAFGGGLGNHVTIECPRETEGMRRDRHHREGAGKGWGRGGNCLIWTDTGQRQKRKKLCFSLEGEILTH